jgi:hypothetical protein
MATNRKISDISNLGKLVYDFLREDKLLMEFWTSRDGKPQGYFKEVEYASILYGDISLDYDKWFNKFGKKIIDQWPYLTPPIRDATPYVLALVKRTWGQFEKENHRAPTDNELVEMLDETLKPNADFPQIFLMIDCNLTINALTPEITKKIRTIRKEFKIKRGVSVAGLNIKKYKPKLLNKILKVYRLKQKIPKPTSLKIAKGIFGPNCYEPEKKVGVYYKYGKNIITNFRLGRPFDTANY